MAPIKFVFEKLKKIFENIDFKVNLKDILSVKFTKNEGDTYNVTNQTLTLNLKDATPEQLKQLHEQLLTPAIQKGIPVLEEKAAEKTTQLKEHLPTDKDEELIKFYEGKLSHEYIDALEIALVIRNIAGNEDISLLKQDIITKYPTFGRNLCNLTSEGYFHKHFKELYEDMLSDDDFSLREYRKKVERIVISLPYIEFINQHTKVDETIEKIEEKIGRLKKYGTAKLVIHALGYDNVKKTDEVLEHFEKHEDIVDIDIDKKKNHITATLNF